MDLPTHLIPVKIRDHKQKEAVFIALLEERLRALATQPEMHGDFMKEMRRFLPTATVRDTIEREPYWSYLTQVVAELGQKAVKSLQSTP
jgi:hypothetical protein